MSKYEVYRLKKDGQLLEVRRSSFPNEDSLQEALEYYRDAGYKDVEELADSQPREYQKDALVWAIECFGPDAPFDQEERRNRFLEEALELFQASGGNPGEATELVNYVYSQPKGEVKQEVGGVGLTLALLCTSHNVHMETALSNELGRVRGKIDEIRAKQAAKPKNSPLPGFADPKHCTTSPQEVK